MSRPDVSFEFFPPRSAPAASQLWATITALEPLEPHFVSVTYGAGGTTREQTVATVLRIHTTTRLNAAAHLTCVAASRDEIDAVAAEYWAAGIRHIVALRGDPPEGLNAGLGGGYTSHPDGYSYAADLVAGLKRISRSASRPIPRSTRRRATPSPTSTTSSASSMPAPTGRLPSISSTPRSICASSSGPARPASPRRSFPASCR